MDRRKKEKELEDDLDKVAEHYLELSGEEKLEICEMMLKKMFSHFDNIIFDIDYKKSDYYDQMMLVFVQKSLLRLVFGNPVKIPPTPVALTFFGLL